MVFKFKRSWLRLLTHRLKAAYSAIVLAVYSSILISVYCLAFFGSLDKSDPPSSRYDWIGIKDIPFGSFHWILIWIIVCLVFNLIISVILFAGVIKKNASLCNVWIYLSMFVNPFWAILNISVLILIKYDLPTMTISNSFTLYILMHLLASDIVRALVDELEDLELSRNTNMAGLLAQAQQVLLRLHAPLAIQAG